MLLLAGFLGGALLGFVRARSRGGTLADALQWGFGHGAAGLVLAVILYMALRAAGVLD